MIEQTLSIRAIRLNAVMRGVYLWMGVALSITGVVSFYVARSEVFIRYLIGNRLLFFGLIIGQLGLVLMLSARIHRMGIQAAILSFIAYAGLNGLTLAPIFLIYTGTSIASTFFISAGIFGLMTIWALTTRRNLDSWGRYLFFGLIGILLASFVNLLLRNEGIYWLISIVGVLLFIGLTAYDTQKIRAWCEALGDNPSEVEHVRLSVIGALKLYLDFINMFLFLLRLLGKRN